MMKEARIYIGMTMQLFLKNIIPIEDKQNLKGPK